MIMFRLGGESSNRKADRLIRMSESRYFDSTKTLIILLDLEV
jgi:hypothetical protein